MGNCISEFFRFKVSSQLCIGSGLLVNNAVCVRVVVSAELSLLIVPGCITASTVVSKARQATSMSKWDEVAAAARLTLMINVTQRSIAAINLTPDLTAGDTHGVIVVHQWFFLSQMLIESSSPRTMFACGCCYAKLFIVANIYTFGGAGALWDPRGIDALWHDFIN